MNLNLIVSIEVFLLTMLAVIIWNNQSSKLLPECSRDRSRIVREILTKKLMPIFSSHKVSIPRDCPLHPERDYLWWPPEPPPPPPSSSSSAPDEDSDRVQAGPYRCPVCARQLHTAQALVEHWDELHRHAERDARDDLVCLADYCDIFRCDVLLAKQRLAVERSRSPTYYLLFDYLLFLIFGPKAYGAEDGGGGGGVPLASIDECQPAAMLRLESTCRSIVHQCTTTTTTTATTSAVLEPNPDTEAVSNLSATSRGLPPSPAQLAMVEKSLSEVLCMYLTCEHYHEDILNEQSPPPQVPITLFSIIGLVLLVGFAVCYYLIWTNMFQTRLLGPAVVVGESVDEHHRTSNSSAQLLFQNKNLKQSFGTLPSHPHNYHNQHILKACASKTKTFLRNLFEFNRDVKGSDEDDDEDMYRAEEDDTKSAAAAGGGGDYEQRKKLHRISSIIEEEDDDELINGDKEVVEVEEGEAAAASEEHEKSYNHHSCPVVVTNKRSLKRRAASEEEYNSSRLHWRALFNNLKRASSSDSYKPIAAGLAANLGASTSSVSSSNNSNSRQEILMQDPPLQINWRFVQPMKPPDPNQCFSVPAPGPGSFRSQSQFHHQPPHVDEFGQSYSLSHSQLRSAPATIGGYGRTAGGRSFVASPSQQQQQQQQPRRQNSIEEEWTADEELEMKSQHSHSSMSIRTSHSGGHLYRTSAAASGPMMTTMMMDGNGMRAGVGGVGHMTRELYTKSSMSYNEALHGRPARHSPSGSGSGFSYHSRPRSHSHHPATNTHHHHHHHHHPHHQHYHSHYRQPQQYSTPPPPPQPINTNPAPFLPPGVHRAMMAAEVAPVSKTASNASITSRNSTQSRHSSSSQAFGK